MITELTLAEYMEMVQSEGLLTKSMRGDILTFDSIGSAMLFKSIAQEEPALDEEEDEDDDEKKQTDEDSETATLTISTDDCDRFNDVLDPMGCETDDFQRNPLFLFEHGRGKNGPMTNPDSILGKILSVTMSEKCITAEARYIPMQSNSLPTRILEMERKGLIPGNSIGWRPLAGISKDDAGKRFVKKWELIEVSKVIVPVNGKATNKQVAH